MSCICFRHAWPSDDVFSNAAIAELAVFSRWLRESDVRVWSSVPVSHRPSVPVPICRTGLAYDMIMADARRDARSRGIDHFLSSPVRRCVESKPAANRLRPRRGLALGGGGELALATHHRVMVDNARCVWLAGVAGRAVAGVGETQRRRA